MITLVGVAIFLTGWLVGVLSAAAFVVYRGISIVQGGG